MPLSGLSIGILGLGQIGGSIAPALKSHAPDTHIIGFDINQDLCEVSVESRIIDKAATDANELIATADIVVLALPVFAIVESIVTHSRLLKQKKLVTDTGSLKTAILNAAEHEGLDNFVGGHPLAGTEMRGSQSWNAGLFSGKNYFSTHARNTSSEARILMSEFIRRVHAVEVLVSPESHDQLFATSSNLPHLFAYLLKSQLERKSANGVDPLLFECPSYRSATRVAASDPQMVFQMLWGNRQNLKLSLAEMQAALDAAQKALDSDDKSEFRRIFGGE